MLRYIKKSKCLIVLTIIFSTISSMAYVSIALLLQNILDIATSGNLKTFYEILLFSLFFFVFLGTFMFLYSLFSKKLICKIINSIREKAFSGIINHNIADFSRANTADYLSALTNDIKIIEDNCLLPLLEIIQNITIFIISLIVMFYFDMIVTISVLAAILIMLIVPGLFGLVMQKKQTQYSKKLSEFTIHLNDILSGFEVISSYGMKNYIISKFGKTNKATTDAKYSVEKVTAANQSVSMVLAILVQVVVIFLSAYFIIIGRITVGTLMGMVQVASNLANPLLIIFSNVPKIKSISPVMARINSFSDYSEKSFTGTVAPTCQKGLSAVSLSFSYDKEKQILNDVSINICKGKKYALVGKNGCGKTTLIKLLSGYYPDYHGTVCYDDIDILELDYSKLTSLSSTIHQDVYMFHESVFDNICLHHNYTEEELHKALNISGVSQFIEKLSDGLETIIEENGNNLSGGQKQRIAVARAVIQEKPILFLDEGTSAIDRQTAYDIENRLLNLDDLTLITITHNLQANILGQYDQIIYMEDGTIKEIGTFGELIQKKSGFYNFSQLKHKVKL